MSHLYLSDILIGCQDDFVKSWGWDLNSLLESDRHHGSLEKKQNKTDFIFENLFKQYETFSRLAMIHKQVNSSAAVSPTTA